MCNFNIVLDMNIDDILFQLPKDLQESPPVQMLVQIINIQSQQFQKQAEQFQKQAEQIQGQAEQIASQKKMIEDLKDEISRLRKTPKRPKFRPGKLEPRNRRSKDDNACNKECDKERSNYFPNKKLVEIRIKPEFLPEDATRKGYIFKGYQNFSVEEIEILAKEIIYKLEVWQAPTGEIIRGKLPKELRKKHFGVELRTLIINLYAGGMTQPAIFDFLCSINIKISEGQVNNILLEESDAFSKISEDILKAGLEEAPYIRTDDTGEKHEHKNAYCTHIGGKYFAYYKTSFSKSRENFLKIFLQGKEGYYINDAMIWHLFQCGVKDHILNVFEEYKSRKYTSKRGLNRLLNFLDIRSKKLHSQCHEAALVGFISETILKPNQVLMSDRAGQFIVFNHASCWIHMERPLRKISPTCKKVEKELNEVREAIWVLYAALKEASLTQHGKEAVIKQYDALVKMKSISPGIHRVINNFKECRDDMLKALDHPGLPLHNNDSERDIRSIVKRRNISGSTKSETGRNFRDGLIGIKQTCFRLGYSFWKFSSDWFKGTAPDLSQIVRKKYRSEMI